MCNTDSIAGFLTNELKNDIFIHRKGVHFHYSVPRNQEPGENEEKRCTYRVKNINYGVGNAAKRMRGLLIRHRGASNSENNDMYGGADWTGGVSKRCLLSCETLRVVSACRKHKQ